jgi:hypothetical protein
MFVTCGKKIRMLYLYDMSRHARLSLEGLERTRAIRIRSRTMTRILIPHTRAHPPPPKKKEKEKEQKKLEDKLMAALKMVAQSS